MNITKRFNLIGAMLVLGLLLAIPANAKPKAPDKASLLLVHAHPDDEGIFGGPIIPYYAQGTKKKVIVLITQSISPDGSELKTRVK